MQEVLNNIDDVIREWAALVPTGIPQIENEDHVQILESLLSSKFDKQTLSELLMEIDQSEKDSVATIISDILKDMVSDKSLVNIQLQYPPRKCVIGKENKVRNVKAIFNANGIGNNEREVALNDIVAYFKKRRMIVSHSSDRIISYAGHVEVRIGKDIVLYVALKGMKRLLQGNVTTTNVKEGLVSILYQVNGLEAFTIENIAQQIAKINAKLKFTGESDSTVESVMHYLKDVPNTKQKVQFVNQAFSVARTLKSAYPDWIIDRNQIFSRIRTAAAQATGTYPDKWCPADVYLINPRKANVVTNTLAKLSTQDKAAEKIQLINDMFVGEWGKKDKAIVGISLKMAKAQGGKAKDFLRILSPNHKVYNLTSDELSWKVANFKDGILRLRKLLRQQIKSSDTKFIYHPPGTSDLPTQLDKLKQKYASLKLLTSLLSFAEDPTKVDDIIVSAVAFGLSLSGINPPYFKCIGDASGNAVVPEVFKSKGVLTLHSSRADDEEPTIRIYDVNTNTGVGVIFAIEKGDEICDVQLYSRSNGMSQATLEIMKIKCRLQQ